jgi:hypothetical protein
MFVHRYLPCLLAAGGLSEAGGAPPPPPAAAPGANCDPLPPPPPPSPWKRFKTWFKKLQRHFNDWLLVPLICYVFLAFPYWLSRNTDGPIVNFPASYLNTPVFGIVLVTVAFAFAWNFMHVQFPDEYRTINTFRDVHRELLQKLTDCTDPVLTARMEFTIIDLWKRLRYSLLLLFCFFIATLAASVAALIVA